MAETKQIQVMLAIAVSGAIASVGTINGARSEELPGRPRAHSVRRSKSFNVWEKKPLSMRERLNKPLKKPKDWPTS